MKIAVAQIDCDPGNLTVNCGKLSTFTSKAKREGAEMIVFPELVDTGYKMSIIEECASDLEKGLPIQTLKNSAIDGHMHIVAGLSERTPKAIYNVAVVIDPDGNLITKYRKVQLYLPAGEGVFDHGSELVTFPLGDFTFGLMICYDIRFPEIARSLALKGADILLIPTAWPFPRVEHWQLLTRVRAIENQCYLIGANRVGRDGETYLSGNSRIVDPHGVIISSASEDQEEIIYALVDREKIDFVRTRMPVFDHRQPDIYLH